MGGVRAGTNVPTESVEQQCLFRWASYAVGRLPELALMFHIPNGGTRAKSEAGRFKAEGVKAGVPDIFLPAPRGGYAGLFIEMKRRKNGRVSIDQATWLKALEKQGYKAIVAHGWEEARDEIEGYLKNERTDQRQDGRCEEDGLEGAEEAEGARA